MSRFLSSSTFKKGFAIFGFGVLFAEYAQTSFTVILSIRKVAPSLCFLGVFMLLLYLFCQRCGVYRQRTRDTVDQNFLLLVCCFVLASCFGFLINNFDVGAFRRIVPWFFGLALMIITYRLPRQVLSASALLAVVIYCVFFWEISNPAIFNIHILGFLLLGGCLAGSWINPLLILFMLNARLMDSDSGLLAALCALGFLHYRFVLDKLGVWKAPLGVGFLLVLLGLAYYLPSASSISDRLDFYRIFTERMSWDIALLGAGPGQLYELGGYFYRHMHCMPLTLTYEYGLVGVFLVVLFIGTLAKSFSDFPMTVRALFVAYGLWSFIDEPIHLMGGMGIFLCALNMREVRE